MGGRGPRTKTRAPISFGYGDVKIFPGKVVNVNLVTHTVDVVGENGEQFNGISFMPKFINADGTGSFVTAENNMPVMLCCPSNQTAPFIMGAASIPLQPDEDDGDPNDHRMNRPVLNEGDEMISSRDTGYIIMRKGGMIEFGSSQLAKTFYIPVENLVQTFCQNFIIDTPGASLTMLERPEDETWGADAIPMEFQLGIKEFSNDEFNIFDLRVGRVAAEDDTYIPIVGATGGIVARLVINRHFTVNIDKDGNCLRTMLGSDVDNVEGARFTTIQKTYQRIVKGLYSHVGKDRITALDGSDTLSVGTTRNVTVGGSVIENIAGAVTRTVGGSLSEEVGGVTRSVHGSVNETISNVANQSVGGGKTTGVGANWTVGVGGKLTMQVGNGQLGSGELAGLEIILANGELHIVDNLGTIIFAAGGLADAASARVVMKPSGAIIVQSSLGATAEFEVNNTGIRLKTPAGEITLDLKGSVALGVPGGGAVVTTLTHPVDYITGAPILGASSVSAGGVPSPTPIATTFVADVS